MWLKWNSVRITKQYFYDDGKLVENAIIHPEHSFWGSLREMGMTKEVWELIGKEMKWETTPVKAIDLPEINIISNDSCCGNKGSCGCNTQAEQSTESNHCCKEK